MGVNRVLRLMPHKPIKPIGLMMRLQKQYGFNRSYKVTRADAFASALRMRVCARSEVFSLHYVALSLASSNHQASLSCPQLGLVFPKRLAKSAVLRNTLRRIARESFRHTAGQLPAGIWIVRLMGTLTRTPCSASHKRLWRQQMDALWPVGIRFAHDLSLSRSRRQ